MSDLAAVDSSPLIVLSRVAQLDLLRATAGTIVVPDAVLAEVSVGGRGESLVREIRLRPWMHVESTPPSSVLRGGSLGAGEMAVLTWCIAHPGSVAVLDDHAGRVRAERLGIHVRGTLGIVLTAKLTGMIPRAKPILHELRATGMYMTDRLIHEALLLVGEEL